MKRVFRFFLTAVAIAAMVISCGKPTPEPTPEPDPTVDPEPEPEPEPEPDPEPVVITDYYVSVEGAGTKDGTSAENAFGLEDLRAFILQPMKVNEENPTELVKDEEKALELAALLDGLTIHFADGTYVLNSSVIIEGTEVFVPAKLEFNGYEKQVNLTLEGSENAILSGGGQYRVLTLGNQIDLTLNGMSVKDGNLTAEQVSEDGAGILVAAGASGNATLRANGTLFSNNRNKDGKSGGAVRVGKGTFYANDCLFDELNYARNGGSIFTSDKAAKVYCEDCTFKSSTYNTGGAANNSKGEQNYINCTFDGCYTLNGTGGAIHANGEDAVVNISGCTFKNCRAYVTELEKPNDNKASGIISMQTASVDIEGTTFQDCYSSAGAVILMQKSSACLLRCNDCLFFDNKGRSRGLIQIEGGNQDVPSLGIAFFNNCVFNKNTMVTGAWGGIFHGANPTAACFNNCTIYDNTRGTFTNQSVGLNTDGTLLVANTTYINADGLACIRNTNTNNGAQLLVANSIVLNTGADVNGSEVKDFMNSGAMKAPLYVCNSIMGQTYGNPGSNFTDFASILDATEETIAGSWDKDRKVYVWNGPAEEFTKITPEEYEAAIKSVTMKNGNTLVPDELGTAFYNWLVEIGVAGKDALGNARGASWWPGAYQPAI